MLKRERQHFIMKYLSLHGNAKVSVISEALQVSHDTILRDLKDLSEQGLLTRVHGGAFASSELSQVNCTPYQSIAKKALLLLSDRSFIFSSGGEAVMALYALLPLSFNATLLTVSMEVAAKFSEHPTLEVIQIGDRVQKTTKMAAGSEAISKIRQINANLCLIDATAIDSQRGITEEDWQTAHVKMAMTENADVTVCLATSAALGKISPIQACKPQGINYLITELDFNDPALESYRHLGITIL